MDERRTNWERIREGLLDLLEKHRFRQPGWKEHDDATDSAAWEEVKSRFNFGYDAPAEPWPAFHEPAPSFTWRVSDLLRAHDSNGDDFQRSELRLKSIVVDALRSCVEPTEEVLFLDLNHVGYAFSPHRLPEPDTNSAWPRSIIPWDGYRLLATPDFRLGMFGHPFEETLCAFGLNFANMVATELALQFGPLLRRDGIPLVPPGETLVSPE